MLFISLNCSQELHLIIFSNVWTFIDTLIEQAIIVKSTVQTVLEAFTTFNWIYCDNKNLNSYNKKCITINNTKQYDKCPSQCFNGCLFSLFEDITVVCLTRKLKIFLWDSDCEITLSKDTKVSLNHSISTKNLS